MKARPIFQAILLAVVASLAVACVPGLRSAKSVPAPGQAATKNQARSGLVPVQGSRLTDKELDQRLPPPPPFYKPPRSQDGTAPADESFVESGMKLEIDDAALRFAKEIPNVQHVKTCFSKLYGGWYLLLYVKQGKKTLEHQYSWDAENKQWKVSLAPKEVPPNLLEFHLKGEVADEKCFLLK